MTTSSPRRTRTSTHPSVAGLARLSRRSRPGRPVRPVRPVRPARALAGLGLVAVLAACSEGSVLSQDGVAQPATGTPVSACGSAFAEAASAAPGGEPGGETGGDADAGGDLDLDDADADSDSQDVTTRQQSLLPAFDACADLAEFEAAAAAYPDATTGEEPADYVARVCAEEASVADSALCADAGGSSGEPSDEGSLTP